MQALNAISFDDHKTKLITERQQVQAGLLHYLRTSPYPSLQRAADYLAAINENDWMDALDFATTDELKLFIDKLEQIEAALAHIEMGIFGLCADCEEEIDADRLYKTPWLQRCCHCDAAK